MRIRLSVTALRFLLLLLTAAVCDGQQVALLGLRSFNHAGAFHSLKQDAAGNLYTLFDAHDGVRILKLSSDGTQVLAQTQIGQSGDTGIALALDNAGSIYIAGTSTSLGAVTGTSGTAFPNRADSTTNSFVARFSPTLALQWLSFVGSGKTAVTAIDASTSAVYVTGDIYAATLPVTSGGVQQTPAPTSGGNGFVEAFNATTGTLQYATYLTGAHGDTQPAAIVADSTGSVYVAGTTTAIGYPTTSALVPVMRYAGASPVSGFVSRLTAAGDGFLFSTFIPGSGLTSAALDANGQGALLLAGNLASGLFPLTSVQQAIANGVSYQSALRMVLDGSSVLSSTLLAPSTYATITSGLNGQSVVAASPLITPLLSLQPLESLGSVAMLRVNASGMVDRVSRMGGIPVNNSGYASIPVTADSILLQLDGTIAVAASVAPTLSSELLPSEHYDFPLAAAPTAALPSTVRDALPLATCTGSACSGSAGMLTRLSPDVSGPQLSLSMDDHPNLVLRNLGPTDAGGLQLTATNYSITSDCGATLSAGAACNIALAGTAAGSITLQAANAVSFTTSLSATSRVANAIVVTPRELDFGIVTSASSANTQTLTLRNLSNAIQTVASTRINSVSTAYGLRESASTCATTTDGTQKLLAANSACTITLAITPSSNSSSDGPVNATWQVGAYDIPVTGYAQAAATSLSSTTIDFGRQYRNGLHSSRYVYLSNASDQPQSHSSVVSTNAAFVITDECPSTLKPHAVCRIAMDYSASIAPSSDALSLLVDGTNVTVLGETLPQPSIGGTTANPNLTLSAMSVSFTDPVTVTTASTAIQTITVGNSGATAFALQTGITGDFTQTSDCPAMLGGGASCKVDVVFTPSAPGLRQGLLAVTAGSAGSAYVTLSGTGSAILPASNGLTFGDIPLNTPTVQWLKVQQGLVSVTVSSDDAAYQTVLVEDSGFGHGQPPASGFSSVTTGSCLNCWLGIQFRPLATGVAVATISVSSSNTGKPTSVLVSGNGVPLSGVILTPMTQDFGTVPVHSGSASTQFQLTNATVNTISTTSVATTGDFRVTPEVTGASDCAAATLPPGDSCFVMLQFVPAGTGTRSGELTMQTTAGAIRAALTGTGSVDLGVGITPDELLFDNVPGVSAIQQVLTLTNTSNTVQTVGTPTSSSSQFSASSTCSTLAPSASCTITVTYTPAAAFTSGTLSIAVTTSPAGAPTTNTYSIPLTGRYTSESAGIQIIPGEHSTVNFGAASTDVLSSSRTMHVNNLSGKPLAIRVATPRNFSVAANTCNTLASSGSCELSIQFLPQTASSITGTMFVQGVPTDGSATQNGLGYLEGYGQGTGSLSITGNLSILGVLSFGQATSGQSSSQTITLTNPISATSSVTVRRIQSAAPFLSTTTCGQPLAPGQSCAITVTYAPVYQVTGSSSLIVARSDTSSITIESNASDAPQFVNVSAQAAPVSSASAVNGEALQSYTLSQGSLTFGTTAVGSSSTAQTITLANTGAAAVHIQKLIPSNGFVASGNCATLQVGASCTVAVAYQPQVTGTTVGTLEIQSDAVASLDFVSLVGIGSTASVALGPQSLDFGRVRVGSSNSQLATLTNTGAVPITLNAVTVSGAAFSLIASSSLSVCPAAGGTLNPGASCTIAISFKPNAAGTLRGTLSVATSATALPLMVALSGVGTQPLLVATPTSLDFGTVRIGPSSTLSFTLRNIGSDAVDGLAFSTTQDFSVANTCGITTLNAGSSCSVSVTYHPSSVGTATGTVTIRSTDPASPLLVPLTATANAGGRIVLTVNGGSSASATVPQGVSATYALSVAPTNGYAGMVALTCTPDSTVAYATCSVLPSVVTLTNGPQSSTVTITTIMEVNAAQLRSRFGGSTLLATLLPAGILFFCLRRYRSAMMPTLLLGAFFIAGCGGGPDPHIRYVAQGTYGFHVTASSTNGTVASQSVSLTLIVAPKN